MKLLLLSVLMTTILLLSSQNTISQEDVPFQAQENIYIKGNSRIIGNTILSKHKTKPFDSKRVANDVIKMKYVDIDKDKSTFSSSAAEISIPETSSRVVYAGLYWSGLYPGEKSTMRLRSKSVIYKTKGGRNVAIDTVLVKTEGQAYTKIKGDIVFDSNNSGPYKKDSPYVYRANITDYLNDSPNVNGMFTVANINATRGKLEGGSAAGWLLYVVYEDETQTPKYFTTYDGFTQIAKEEALVIFTDFQAKKEGSTDSTLVMAALEGDIKIKSDECSILNTATGDFVIISNIDREGKNFFNSSITNSEIRSTRNPASINTLGFDLVKTKLPPNIIENSATQVTIKFKTRADRFYIFFTAFETEIEESYLISKNKNTLLQPTGLEIAEAIEVPENNSKGQEFILEVKVDTPLKLTEVYNVIDETKAVASSSVQSTKVAPLTVLDSSITEEEEIRNIKIEGMTPGYYLVTNIFAVTNNAEKWINRSIRDGYNPQTFVNPENNWTYIYIERSTLLPNLKNKKDALRLKVDYEKVWILEINNTLKGIDSSVFRETIIATILETEREPVKESLSIISEEEIRNIKIEGMVPGYYLVTDIFPDTNNAKKWINKSIRDGYNPQIFVDPENNWTYIYIERSTLLPKLKNKKDALTLKADYEKVWIIEISNTLKGIDSSVFRETTIATILETEREPVKESLSIISEEEIRNIKIEGMVPGYYLVTDIFPDTNNAKKWINKSIRDGYNPQTFVDPENNWTYIYIERSTLLPNLKNKKDALTLKADYEKVWIIEISNTLKGTDSSVFRETIIDTILEKEREPVKESLSIISEEEIRNIKIEGMVPGYYLVTDIFPDTNNAKKWINKSIRNGNNPQTFVDPENNWTYIYIERSTLLPNLKNKKDALTLKADYEKVWIIEISNTLKGIDSSDFRETIIDTILETEREPVKESLSIISEEEEEIRNIKIEGMVPGYYLVTNIFAVTDNAEKWINRSIRDGYNPQTFVNPENNWTYIYIERSNLLPNLKNKKDALRLKVDYEKVWILEISNTLKGIDSSVFRETIIDTILEKEREPVKESLSIISEEEEIRNIKIEGMVLVITL